MNTDLLVPSEPIGTSVCNTSSGTTKALLGDGITGASLVCSELIEDDVDEPCSLKSPVAGTELLAPQKKLVINRVNGLWLCFIILLCCLLFM